MEPRRELIKRALGTLSTGIAGFEQALGSEIPNGSLIMLVGDSSSHHRSFAQQVMYNHVISKGKVVYYSVEESPLDILEDMQTFNWNIQSYLDDGSWLFVRVIPPTLQKISELLPELPYEAKLTVSSTSLDLLKQDILQKGKEGRWITLPLSYLLQNYEYREIQELILYWLGIAHTYGGLHLILLNNGGIHEERIISSLEHNVDGVFKFEMRPRMGGAEGFLNVKKLRKTLVTLKQIGYVISEGGIVIETLSRII
ncbi:Circadian clock protein kinase KaiC [archaeon HR06]|nr:Circadian clock protein kinase KaiC [archaeon HR06]